MKKTNIDGEIKLKFSEIIFSPIISLWNMAKSVDEVEDDDIRLNLDSTNAIEKELAESQNAIDEMVNEKYKNIIGKNKKEKIDNNNQLRKQYEIKEKNNKESMRSETKQEKQYKKIEYDER